MNDQIDWSNLSFGYMPTDYNVRCSYSDGKWGDIEVSDSPYFNIHIAATGLHYGQEIFEGLKASAERTAKSVFSVFVTMPRAFVTLQKDL